MDELQLEHLVKLGREERYLEYKSAAVWDDLWPQVIKCCLAMANKKDGGFLVVGVKDRKGRHELVGLDRDQFNTYNADTIRDKVDAHAEPYLEIDVHTPEIDGMRFVVIKIHEFSETPVVCKKKVERQGKTYVEAGQMLTRTLGRRPESAPVIRVADLRDIIDLALVKTATRCQSIELASKASQEDVGRYQEQLGGL